MKTKNGLVRHFISFNYSEIDALSEYLEKCESEGLRFRHMTNMFLYFERCEPKKVRYSAEVFRPIKNAWFGKTEMNGEFVDLCRQAGWQLVDFDGASLYVFRSEDLNAVPIMTDEKEKLSLVTKEFTNKSIFPFGLALVLWIINLISKTVIFSLFEPFDILTLLSVSLVLTVLFVRLVSSLSWYRKARKSIKNSQMIEYGDIKSKIRKDRTTALVLTIFVILLFLSFAYLLVGSSGKIIRMLLYTVSVTLMICEIIILTADKASLTVGRLKAAMVIPPVAASLVLILLLPFCGFFAQTERPSKQAVHYDSSGQMLIDERTIPVTLSDFGIGGAEIENTTIVRGTRFARVGEYSSVQDVDGFGADEKDAVGEMLDYAVCISPYQQLRDSFLNEHIKYMLLTDESVALGSEKWDRVYYRKTEYRDFIGCCVAQKGDVLLILDCPILEEIDETLNLFYDRIFQ